MRKWPVAVLSALSSLYLASCGGGGGSVSGTGSGTTVVTPASNVLSVVVDSGPSGNSINTLFTSVTICVQGSTSQCQTIDHIQVDTGSNGLRVLNSVLTVSLPTNAASDGNTLAECTQFVDGYSWGPVASADIQVAGETASKASVQVIGSTAFVAAPAGCASTGTEEDTVAAFGANGILGIGVFEQDCGTYCANAAQSGYYYSCTETACTPIAAPLSAQVLNPVALFATDNNGTLIQLPAVASAGASTLTGSVIFGVDTQTNNVSGTEKILTVDTDFGDFTTVFGGSTLTHSFIDSGTNGIFFNDSNIATCTNTEFNGFYCPATTQTFTATLTGLNGTSVVESFSVVNAETESTENPTFTALPGIAGAYSSDTDTFDWGLPFYYGRRVATVIEGRTTTVGTGPYIAF